MSKTPEFRVGQKIDDFELIAALGGGQDGEVWKARRLSIGKHCALKFLNAFDDPDKLKRFEREIRILSNLDHPNIVSIQQRGEGWNPSTEKVVPYYVMEFIPGQPLETAVSATAPSERFYTLCSLAQQVLSAIDSIHQAGLSHGDIKSANILISGTPRVAKLSDFGFGIDLSEGRTRTDYPASSHRAPAELTPVQADLYRFGKTIEQCLSLVSADVPHVSYVALKGLIEELTGSPPRLTAAEAMRRFSSLQSAAEARGFLSSATVADDVPELAPLPRGGSLVRDVFRGDIPLSERARRLIDLPPLQRLRAVRLAPTVELVYPSFSPSLFEETLGEYSTTRQALLEMLRQAEFEAALSPTHAKAVIAATLIRHVGEFPFASLLSNSTASRLKETAVAQAVNAGLGATLSDSWELDPNALLAILQGDTPRASPPGLAVVKELLHGALAPWRYARTARLLARCGISSPTSEQLDQLYSRVTVSPDQRVLVLREKALPMFEAVAHGYALALERVLWHKTVRSAELMLREAFGYMEEAGFDFGTLANTSEHDFLARSASFTEEQGLAAPKALIAGYQQRALFKLVLSVPLEAPYHRWDETSLRRRLSAEIAHHLGVAHDSILLDLPHTSVRRRLFDVPLLLGDEIRSVLEVSPILAAVAEQLRVSQRAVRIYAHSSVARVLTTRSREIAEIAHQFRDWLES